MPEKEVISVLAQYKTLFMGLMIGAMGGSVSFILDGYGSFSEFVSTVVVSVFLALVVGFTCEYANVPQPLTYVAIALFTMGGKRSAQIIREGFLQTLPSLIKRVLTKR